MGCRLSARSLSARVGKGARRILIVERPIAYETHTVPLQCGPRRRVARCRWRCETAETLIFIIINRDFSFLIY